VPVERVIAKEQFNQFVLCSIKILLHLPPTLNECNTMRKIILLACVMVTSVLISSCGSGTDEGSANEADTTVVDTTASMVPEEPQEYISVPSPDEMFSFIKAVAGAGKSVNYLNNTDNIKNYVETKSKALNFGVYATDFLYCSTFDFSNEIPKYFIAVKKLGDELGISNVISEEVQNRIKANSNKSDSLMNIANPLYYSAVAELEKSDKAPVLVLLIAGGWIESMYLATNMIKKFKHDDRVIDRIAEQKYTLDNLIEFMNKYNSDDGVAAVISQLNELKLVYDQLQEESANGTVSTKDGKKVLGGGAKITITEAQYKAISEKVKSIRESFTMTKI
jgi:hypothetical protein